MSCSMWGTSIAQSIEEKLPLLTADPVFERYPVNVIW
jgi:PIN domain nuclease of toxin-antitoxin system